jgi:uncharacterized protein
MVLPAATLILLGALSAALGSLGGIGGATLLVPVLLVMGVDPLAAAPLGLLTVAAGSLAAAARQLDEGLVHHRLGLTIELTASIGTVAGALIAAQIPDQWLERLLGTAALLGAIAALSRRGVRNLAVGIFDEETRGEWPGTLGGQYPLGGHMVPYQARRIPEGLGVSSIAGLIAGVSGVGGGFVKTPAMSEIMGIPVKVAAATTTFTLGITASTGLLIYWLQDRLDMRGGAAVIVGALLGGVIGARIQAVVPPRAARWTTGVLLVVVGVVVIGRSM